MLKTFHLKNTLEIRKIMIEALLWSTIFSFLQLKIVENFQSKIEFLTYKPTTLLCSEFLFQNFQYTLGYLIVEIIVF